MEAIGTVVLMKTEFGSYAVAGVTGGAVAAGIAFGATFLGRLIDRNGRRILVPFAVVHVAMMALLVVAGIRHWPTALLILFGFGVGSSVPPTSPVFRTLYPAAVGRDPDAVQSAFALDAALTDATYVAGPALVSAGIIVASPGVALLFAAACGFVSALLVHVRAPAATAVAPAVTTTRLGALNARGVLLLTLATIPLGMAFGICEVAYVAFGVSQGNIAFGGFIYTFAGMSSALMALVYGARSMKSPAGVFTRQSVWIAPTFLMPLAGNSVAAVALLTVPLGGMTGPWTVARNQLTGALARPGTEVEAYAWPLTALLAGTALGTAIDGPLVGHVGWRLALVVASVICALTGVIVLPQRRRLREPPIEQGGIPRSG
jgi:MFS family permease